MNLRKKLQEKRITIVEFAKLLGVHRDTVQKWLSGAREPNPEMLERIKAFFRNKEIQYTKIPPKKWQDVL